MDLRERIAEATRDAMRARAAERLSVLRLMAAAFQDRDIAARGEGQPSPVSEDGVVAAAVGAWPLLGALCFAPVITGALRWWRWTGVLAAAIGVLAAALSIGILIFALGKVGLTVRLDPIGPSVMAAGGLLLIGGGIGTTFGNSFTRPPQGSSKFGGPSVMMDGGGATT